MDGGGGSRGATRTGAVMDAIRRRIAARQIAPGERRPSIRGLARAMGVSPSTVVDAYDRLAAERPRRREPARRDRGQVGA